ncbi:MAG: clan AA aspartic protease [Gammaproteobacteria bacterium]|nr:clan AA aspartic protease [Gammaproteobacteria bacterium]
MMRFASLLFLSVFAITVCAADFDATMPLRDVGTSTYYVEARINDHAIQEFMLDTGSAHVVIDKKTFSQLKEKGDVKYMKDLSGVLADGSSTSVPIYQVAAINLGRCTIRDVEVAVFPKAGRNILGLSALKKVAPFAISIDPPSLKLSNCQSDQSDLVADTLQDSGNEITDHVDTLSTHEYSEHSAFYLPSLAP